ncbi:hypothetical protein Ancab_002277, partial [Ancistrocladus abbreviatus]
GFQNVVLLPPNHGSPPKRCPSPSIHSTSCGTKWMGRAFGVWISSLPWSDLQSCRRWRGSDLTYDIEKHEWVTCQSMPGILKDSAASTRLSVASIPLSIAYDLRPAGSRVFSWTIGFSGNNLILAGVIGLDREVKGVKLWRMKHGSMNCVEIEEMQVEMVEKLKGKRVVLSYRRVEIGDLQKLVICRRLSSCPM